MNVSEQERTTQSDRQEFPMSLAKVRFNMEYHQ